MSVEDPKKGGPRGKSRGGSSAPAGTAGRTAGRTAKPISAVSRAFVIMEKLSLVSSSSLEDLARSTRLAKPTVYRFLLTLRELGYVRKDDADRWYMTMKLFGVGSRTLDHIELPAVAKPIAAALSAELGETVHMGVMDEDEAVYVLKIESKYTLRMYSRVGKKIPLYCTAIGKILLADMDEAERRRRIAAMKMVPFTEHTIRTGENLERELETVRNGGWGVDAEEHEEGILCIGAPIRDSSGTAVAALSVSWPKFRYEKDRAPDYRARIKAAAAEISSILGYEGA